MSRSHWYVKALVTLSAQLKAGMPETVCVILFYNNYYSEYSSRVLDVSSIICSEDQSKDILLQCKILYEKGDHDSRCTIKPLLDMRRTR